VVFARKASAMMVSGRIAGGKNRELDGVRWAHSVREPRSLLDVASAVNLLRRRSAVEEIPMRFVELQQSPNRTPIFVNPDQVKVLRPTGETTSVEFDRGYAVEVIGEAKQVATHLER
jgi:hypothetical protein